MQGRGDEEAGVPRRHAPGRKGKHTDDDGKPLEASCLRRCCWCCCTRECLGFIIGAVLLGALAGLVFVNVGLHQDTDPVHQDETFVLRDALDDLGLPKQVQETYIGWEGSQKKDTALAGSSDRFRWVHSHIHGVRKGVSGLFASPEGPKGALLQQVVLFGQADVHYPHPGFAARPRVSEFGLQQAIDFGERLREQVVTRDGLVTPNYEPGEVYAERRVWTVRDARAIDTATSLLMGLFPVKGAEVLRRHAPECRCREPEPAPSRLPDDSFKDTDVSAGGQPTRPSCIARCLGLRLRFTSPTGLVLDVNDTLIQPVPIGSENPQVDWALRQARVCLKPGAPNRDGRKKPSPPTDGYGELVEGSAYMVDPSIKESYKDVLESLRALRSGERLCVQGAGRRCADLTLADVEAMYRRLVAVKTHTEDWKESQDLTLLSGKLFHALESQTWRVFAPSKGRWMGGMLLKAMSAYLEAVISGAVDEVDGRRRLTLLGGHPHQLMSLLSALGVEPYSVPCARAQDIDPSPRKLPGAMSDLTLQLRAPARGGEARGHLVVVAYNGKPLHSEVCPGGKCSFDDFRAAAEERGMDRPFDSNAQGCKPPSKGYKPTVDNPFYHNPVFPPPPSPPPSPPAPPPPPPANPEPYRREVGRVWETLATQAELEEAPEHKEDPEDFHEWVKTFNRSHTREGILGLRKSKAEQAADRLEALRVEYDKITLGKKAVEERLKREALEAEMALYNEALRNRTLAEEAEAAAAEANRTLAEGGEAGGGTGTTFAERLYDESFYTPAPVAARSKPKPKKHKKKHG